MAVKKRMVLWDWSNSYGPGHAGVPQGMKNVPFGENSPVASVVNWNTWVPPELEDNAPFRPMVRCLADVSGANWDMIVDSPHQIVLFFNEPERQGITPEQARDIWYSQMIPLRRNQGKQLGSPAVAGDEDGEKWITRFMRLVASDPPDYLCLHWYSDDVVSAKQYLQRIHETYSQHQIMVTEIACIDRNAKKVAEFTAEICNWLDEQDWVFEYGLFVFQRTLADDFISPAAQLMDPDGNFTALGKRYLHAQPF